MISQLMPKLNVCFVLTRASSNHSYKTKTSVAESACLVSKDKEIVFGSSHEVKYL